MKPHLPLLLLSLLVARASAADAPKTPAATTPVAPATTPSTTPAAPATTPATGPVRNNAAGRNPGSSTATASDSFDNFSLITERNIFNAFRTGRRTRSDSAPVVRTDVITLVGTMDSEKGLRAFFDGSDPAYRKPLHVGDSVEKFKVIKIEPKIVELEREGKKLAVNVGQQLRRPEGGDWILAGDVQPLQPRAGVMGSLSRPDPNAAPEISADMSDAEKKMRERRAKSLKN